MVGVGSQSAQAVHGDLLERLEIGVGVEGIDEVQGRALLFQAGQGIGWGEGGGGSGKLGLATGGLDLGLEGLAQFDGLADQVDKAVGVKINIGEAGENGLTGKAINRIVDNSDLAATIRYQAKSLDGMGEEIFETGNFIVLAADTDGGAGDSFGGLFTLITVHGGSPWVGVSWLS